VTRHINCAYIGRWLWVPSRCARGPVATKLRALTDIDPRFVTSSGNHTKVPRSFLSENDLIDLGLDGAIWEGPKQWPRDREFWTTSTLTVPFQTSAFAACLSTNSGTIDLKNPIDSRSAMVHASSAMMMRTVVVTAEPRPWVDSWVTLSSLGRTDIGLEASELPVIVGTASLLTDPSVTETWWDSVGVLIAEESALTDVDQMLAASKVSGVRWGVDGPNNDLRPAWRSSFGKCVAGQVTESVPRVMAYACRDTDAVDIARAVIAEIAKKSEANGTTLVVCSGALDAVELHNSSGSRGSVILGPESEGCRGGDVYTTISAAHKILSEVAPNNIVVVGKMLPTELLREAVLALTPPKSGESAVILMSRDVDPSVHYLELLGYSVMRVEK
jgi:hypothetical protein